MVTHNQIIRDNIFAAAAFFFGVWWYCFRILTIDLSFVPGDLGDARFINYLLEHNFQFFIGNKDGFWNGEFMYPFQNTIALSDNLISSALFYIPFRLFGMEMITAFQIWWLVLHALNYWAAYFVAKKWFSNSIVATIIAWIFAFSVYNLGQMSYPQLAFKFCVPFVFYFGKLIVDNPSFKYLIFFLLSLIFQLYGAMYIGFHLFYFGLLFVAIYGFYHRKTKPWHFYFIGRNSLITILIIAVSLLLMVPLIQPYASILKVVGLRLYKEIVPGLPVWKSFLLPHESSIYWDVLGDTIHKQLANFWLHYLFPGIILILVLLATPFIIAKQFNSSKKFNPGLMSVGITSLIICLLHIRFGDQFTFYGLIFKLPGIGSIRVMNRFMHVEIFLLSLTLGYVLVYFKKVYWYVIFTLIVVDNSFCSNKVIRTSKQEIESRNLRMIDRIKEHKDYKAYEAIAYVNKKNPAYLVHLDMMIAAQNLGLKTINGYSSYCPDSYGRFFLNADKQGLNSWLVSQDINPNRVLIIKDKD